MEVDLIVWSKPQAYSKKQMGGFMLHVKVSHEVCAGQCGDGKQMQVDEMISSPTVMQLIEKVVLEPLCPGFLSSFEKWWV